MPYRVHAEDSDDLVPLRPHVWLPAEFLGQAASEVIDALLDLERRVRLPRETAGQWVSRIAEGIPPIRFFEHEIMDRNGVRHVRQLRHPGGRMENHCEQQLARRLEGRGGRGGGGEEELEKREDDRRSSDRGFL